MDCFGTYFTHVQTRNVTRVQSHWANSRSAVTGKGMKKSGAWKTGGFSSHRCWPQNTVRVVNDTEKYKKTKKSMIPISGSKWWFCHSEIKDYMFSWDGKKSGRMFVCFQLVDFRDSDLSFLERKGTDILPIFFLETNLHQDQNQILRSRSSSWRQQMAWSFHLESQVFLGIQGFFRGLSWSFVVALANPGERYSTARGGGCDVTRWQGDIFDTHKGLKRGHVLKDLKTCVV